MANVQTAIPFKVVPAREERRQQFAKEGWWYPVPITKFSSNWLYKGEHRLDAGYYADDVIAALHTVNDCRFPLSEVEYMTESIFYPTRFKRIWASRDQGVPFIGGTEILHLRPDPKFISASQTVNLSSLFVEEGYILITRSGSTGRAVFANKTITSYAISEHVIRVVPLSDTLPGYLYAFLASTIGQTLINRNTFGSTVPEIEPHHIASIPVPIVPEPVQQAIHNEVVKAYAIRDEANDLLDEADEKLHRELGLPRFDESLVKYLPPPPCPKTNRPGISHPRAFTVRASELSERLDSSYHVPAARTAVELLQKGKYASVQLENLTEDIFMPPTYKRIYVSRQHGEPILSGSNLFQIHPYDLQFISPKAFKRPSVEAYRVITGWVLVTGRGTTGKAVLVSNGWHGWLASHNILRIVPKLATNPGYLLSFLLSRYGTVQMEAKNIGSVVDVLTPEDLATIWVPNAPNDIQSAIGELVVSAFEKKDEANAIEEAAIRRLETALQKSDPYPPPKT